MRYEFSFLFIALVLCACARSSDDRPGAAPVQNTTKAGETGAAASIPDQNTCEIVQGDKDHNGSDDSGIYYMKIGEYRMMGGSSGTGRIEDAAKLFATLKDAGVCKNTLSCSIVPALKDFKGEDRSGLYNLKLGKNVINGLASSYSSLEEAAKIIAGFKTLGVCQ